MICPRCGDEYRQGFRECTRCEIPLVDEHVPLAPDQHLTANPVPGFADCATELVTVFRTYDVMQLAVAESILRSAQVEFMTRGRDVQGLFGWGGFPTGASLTTGCMDILCRQEDAADARAMLENLATGSDDFALDDSFDPEE